MNFHFSDFIASHHESDQIVNFTFGGSLYTYIDGQTGNFDTLLAFCQNNDLGHMIHLDDDIENQAIQWKLNSLYIKGLISGSLWVRGSTDITNRATTLDYKTQFRNDGRGGYHLIRLQLLYTMHRYVVCVICSNPNCFSDVNCPLSQLLISGSLWLLSVSNKAQSIILCYNMHIRALNWNPFLYYWRISNLILFVNTNIFWTLTLIINWSHYLISLSTSTVLFPASLPFWPGKYIRNKTLFFFLKLEWRVTFFKKEDLLFDNLSTSIYTMHKPISMEMQMLNTQGGAVANWNI